jgi:hypothetical protein
MTAASLTLPRSEPRSATLRGQVIEFLVVGGATPLCFLLSWLLRQTVGLDAADLAVGFTMFHAAFIVNDPHFAVTYLLFYEDFKGRALGDAFPRALRARYLATALAVPALLAAWALHAIATDAAEQLGLMIELMFLLVGWHYVKQGFGVMIVLASRRSVHFTPTERRVILAHCFAGWAYSWANPHQLARLQQEKGLIYLSIERPHLLELIALVALAATTVALLATLWLKYRRERRWPLITPLTALLCSIWFWLVFSGADPLVRYMTPALHSLQYLYFVFLLKRNEAADRTQEPHFEPPPRERLAILAFLALGLGFLLFHAAPELLDLLLASPPGIGLGVSLGPTPYFAALYAIVNIHHYFMDNVIWRRDNPRTRYLTAR